MFDWYFEIVWPSLPSMSLAITPCICDSFSDPASRTNLTSSIVVAYVVKINSVYSLSFGNHSQTPSSINFAVAAFLNLSASNLGLSI